MARQKLNWRLGVFRLALGLGATLGALALAETLSGFGRQHAFPFLNLFVADSEYGVVLRPGGQTRTRSRLGRITDIQLNTAGFRDDPWEEPSNAPDTQPILLLGDSQVFAYGVPAKTGMAHLLEERLGRPVHNGAIPTWGPTEYLKALEELGERYQPSDVLFVANAANDWFEAKVPNTRRTTARNGWALRVRQDLPAERAFPGSAWLLNRSHLYFFGKEIIATAQRPNLGSAQGARILVRDLDRLRQGVKGFRSSLGPSIERARNICNRLGCNVALLTLPLDVQVHPEEWSKYRQGPVDMEPTEILLSNLIDDAEELGVRGVNLLPVLRDAMPGAFLPDDYHLSEKGHRAVAEAAALLLSSTARLSGLGSPLP